VAEVKILNAGFEDNKEDEINDYFKSLSDEAKIKIFKVDSYGKRQYIGRLHSLDLQNDDIHEVVKSLYGAGTFFVQAFVNGKLSKGSNIFIAESNVKTQENNNFEIHRQIEDLKNQVVMLSSRRGEESDELKMLEKMKIYKELFGGGGGSHNLMKDIAESFREGLELGKMINNPEPVEKDNGLTGLISSFLPLLMQQQQQPQQVKQLIPFPVQQQQQKIETQPENKNEGEEMLQYIGLLSKVRKTANCRDEEERQSKIEHIAEEILEFHPDIINIVKNTGIQISQLIEMGLAKYKMHLSEHEKKVVLDVWEEINAIEEVECRPD